MIHSILSRPLHAPKLWGALEALVTEGTHLICCSSKMSLSIIAAITVASIGATRVPTITPTATTILDLTATKATFWPPTKSPIIVPVPVAATTIAAPPAPRIPITAVILEATSPPPSTTWMTWTQIKHSITAQCHVGQVGDSFMEKPGSRSHLLCPLPSGSAWG